MRSAPPILIMKSRNPLEAALFAKCNVIHWPPPRRAKATKPSKKAAPAPTENGQKKST